jgi:Phosphotransferase enzyme family
VYRPTGWWTSAVHALLRYLQDSGFSYAPRVLGVDGQGHEILTHIPGRSGREGWAAIVTDRGLASFARLLRAYHDAVRSFRPPVGAVCACTDAPLGAGELMCHGDFGPWNVVWQGQQPVGILDWDLAGPGPPMDDVAYALSYSIPFRDDQTALRWLAYNHPPGRRHRIEVFADAYGLPTTAGLVDQVARPAAGPGAGSRPSPAGAAAPGELGRQRLPGRAGGTSSVDRATPRAFRVTAPPTPVNLHRHRRPNAQHPLSLCPIRHLHPTCDRLLIFHTAPRINGAKMPAYTRARGITTSGTIATATFSIALYPKKSIQTNSPGLKRTGIYLPESTLNNVVKEELSKTRSRPPSVKR